MGFDYQTFNYGHVLAIRTEHDLTLDDIHEIDHLIRSHCHQIEGNVHIIVDLMMTEQYPRNVVDMKHEMEWVHQENLGWVVFLSENYYLNKMLDAAMHLSGHNYVMLNDFQAALNLVSVSYEPVY